MRRPCHARTPGKSGVERGSQMLLVLRADPDNVKLCPIAVLPEKAKVKGILFTLLCSGKWLSARNPLVHMP